MRKLISFNLVTLDGYFEGPNHDLSWFNLDDEFAQFADEQTGTFGTLLFGRVTYQLMASFWPTAEAIKTEPIVAAQMNRVPKVAFSRTLQKADWENTRLLRDHVFEEVSRLKQQPGGDIAIFGSANFMATLTQLDLIDEHRILLNPIILGRGMPLFRDIKEKQKLKLVSTRTFRNGNNLLTYAVEKR